jgi:crotonobetainyl-CoA:carnitine CoA-transferase CaiB-like acyl-CoA transferase
MWAGPLCAQLLGDMGARVIKVESRDRPDGARAGPAPFFDLLNGGKESVVLDPAWSTGREQLRCLLEAADIVIESARPRGLEQMGIRAADIVAGRPGRTWLAITGYGREAPGGEWIAYGDDAGVAAGLTAKLAESTGRSVFCGDAIADPLTGLHAALLAWLAWTGGGGALLDVSLAGVVGRCIAAGSTPHDTGACTGTLPPCARPAFRRAAPAGHDTAAILAEFGAPA